jgi:hypothetical protein
MDRLVACLPLPIRPSSARLPKEPKEQRRNTKKNINEKKKISKKVNVVKSVNNDNTS